MKIPEPLFKVINVLMAGLLRSPIHGLMSSSILLLTYQGRKSGKVFKVPVRYTQQGNVTRCFTAKSTHWWYNFINPQKAQILVKGISYSVQVSITTDDPDAILPELTAMLTQFPADAAYQNVTLRDGRPDRESLLAALPTTVMVEMKGSS